MIPYLVYDIGLTPAAFILYCQIKRICGENGGMCWQSVSTLAEHCKMSRPTIIRAKRELAQTREIEIDGQKHEFRLIDIEEVTTKNGRYHTISVNDIWLINVLKYSKLGG
jgi:hypothetical protein